MRYDELIDIISSNKLEKHEYWNLIHSSANLIVEQTNKLPKGKVAEDLGMSPQIFSSVFPLLVAVNDK